MNRMGYFGGAGRQIDLKDNHILEARVAKRGNPYEYQDSVLDLNRLIGNRDGHFEWDAFNFSESATDLTVDGYGDSLRLRGTLENKEGEYVPADIRLGERVRIRDDKLQYSSYGR